MRTRQWIETFLRLADSGAPATDYRRQLGLKTNILGKHIARINEYRKELAAIKAQEEQDDRRRRRQEEIEREEAQDKESDGNLSEPPAGRDEEALGTREDSIED